MCICCCFCNCCNTYSSRCVEFCILVLSSATFICTLLGFFFIKWSNLTKASSILLILLIAFSACIEGGIISINIYRFQGTINKNRNSLATYFAIISLILSIVILFISLISESLVQTNFKEKNIKNIEYTMSYFTSSIIEICSLLSIFFWYNDYRRIREKVDGELSLSDSNYLNRERIAKAIQYREGGEIGDPSDRYLNENINVNGQSILVKNSKNTNNYRKSQQLNLNKKGDSGNHFIRDLRKEMQEAMESLDEESSENKEEVKNVNIKKEEVKKKEVKELNDKSNEIKNNLYSKKRIISNNENNKIKDSNNDNVNIIFVDNEENKEETIEENIEQKDISIFKSQQANEN